MLLGLVLGLVGLISGCVLIEEPAGTRLFQSTFQVEEPVLLGEQRLVASWFVPARVRLTERLFQVSGRTQAGKRKRLPTRLVLRLVFTDAETGEAFKRFRMLIDRSLENGFRKAKKFPKSIPAGSIAMLTVEPVGDRLPAGTTLTICLDAVDKRTELLAFPSCAVGTAAATLGGIQQSVFTGRCATSGCHDAVTAEQDLVLEAGSSFSNLVGVASRESPGELLVRPGDADRSYLVKKLRGSAPIGGKMPLGGPFLSDQEIAGVVEWIENGADDN